ncbi:MAG TPA: tetraacyldisaccharide 4'-kinase [Xanthobacteraceae bacterium]|nr:tetraacyldisaccharide 4'-kinase [Xanthobacteraceae bacterium]
MGLGLGDVMRAPTFWWQPGRGLLLSPLAAVYGTVAWWRMRARGRDAGVPVICLGNLTVGGGGKTPTALAVGRLLLAAHRRPFFLSRGYGGRLGGPVLVNPSEHGAADVGDEPLLLARLASTIVARDRVAGAEAARARGANVIVMDDGFQNPSLKKDLAIIVVDGHRGIGNRRIIPAGPLRAPLRSQLKRAHALIVVGPPDGAAPVIKAARRRGLALFHARLEPDRSTLAALNGRKVLAFAGIADPEKFFDTLTAAGVVVAERQSFADHHAFSATEARMLMAHADDQNLVLITTEKDRARLSGNPKLAALAARTLVLPVRLVIEEEEAFRQIVLTVAKQ